MMRPWMRRMTVEDVAAAKRLSEEKTEAEIVQLARASDAKAGRFRLLFLCSCLAPVAVLASPILWPGIMNESFPLWMTAMIASMLLPMPARVAVDRVHREGAVIALGFWLKKRPELLERLRRR